METRIITPLPSNVPINISQTAVSIATPTKPTDPDVIANASAGQPGYDVISVFNEKKKLSSKIWLINDGPGVLYAVSSPDGENFTGEGDILPHEFRVFTQAWEIRVRSPDGTTKYRVTEFEPGYLA